MSNITMDKRLELIQQIRTQNHQNQYDMISREQLLYGKSCSRNTYDTDTNRYNDMTEGIEADQQPVSSFKIRLLVAVTLLLFGIVLDSSGKSLGKLSLKDISEILAVDYEARIEEQLQDWLITD